MAKGSGGTRSSNSSSSSKRGIDLYRNFVEGGSSDINGINSNAPILGESDLKALDSVFKPLDRDIVTYKGMPDFLTYLKEKTGQPLHKMIGESFIDKFYSSTSKLKSTAEEYAANAFEQGVTPSLITFNIKKGTPVADTIKTLGESGMKGFEQEITLRRNVRYTIKSAARKKIDGEVYYMFEIDVTKK